MKTGIMDLYMYKIIMKCEVTLNLIESQKMSAHPNNPTGENLARYLQTVAAPNIMEYIGFVINKVAVWEI
jgi:hypothetical protein